MIGPNSHLLPRQIGKSTLATGDRLSMSVRSDTTGPLVSCGDPQTRSQYKLAENRQERAGAFGLTYRKYVKAGLIEPNAYQMRVTPFHLLQSTHVFIATHKGQLTCTLTLVGDGAQRLPMECVYDDEVARKRDEGFSLAEVSCLAFEACPSHRVFWSAFLQLNRLMAQFARHRGIGGLLIAIHPRHAHVYQRMMGFEQFGCLRSYPSVRNRPAVACWLDFAKVDSERPPCYEPIFGKPLPAWQLHSRPISLEERDFFHSASLTAGPWLPMTAAC